TTCCIHCSSWALSGPGPRGMVRAGASVPPGAVATIRIPSAAASIAKELVNALTPPLAAEYGTRLTPRIAIDDTLTIVPAPWFFIIGRTARHIQSVGNNDRVISASIFSGS